MQGAEADMMGDPMIHKYEYYGCKKYIRKHARDIHIPYISRRVTMWWDVLRDSPPMKVYSIYVCISRVFSYIISIFIQRGIKRYE